MSFQHINGLDGTLLFSSGVGEPDQLSALYDDVGEEILIRTDNLGGHGGFSNVSEAVLSEISSGY